MRWGRSGSWLFCAVLLAASAGAQEQDFSKIELKTTELAPGLAMLEGVGGFAGGNVAVSYGADGTAIVDDQFVPMVPKIEAAVRKLKDADDNYLWRPGMAGEAASLLGYPVTEIEDMPDIAANSFSIAFGDFRRGYLIVDRQGARVLRDPYSAKPYVLFYTTKRVGGGVQNFDAIKVMKFAAS